MSKTPAMQLHEQSIKSSNSPPVYTLVHQSQGTHENEFEYLVEVLGIKATGRGRSKKEAKQETAKNALSILSKDEMDIEPPDFLEEVEFKQLINYVGELGDLCLLHKFPTPSFDLKLAVGPPHAMEFTYECRLGKNLVTQSKANTKKQAKQNVAKMMFERIQSIYPDLLAENESNLLQLPATDDMAIEEYNRLSLLKMCDFSRKIVDYAYYLRDLAKESQFEDLDKCFEDPPTKDKVEELCKVFNFHLVVEEFVDDITLVATYLDGCEVPVFVLTQGEKAETEGLNELLKTLESLLKE